MALAAYNQGVGRTRDALALAEEMDMGSKWRSVRKALRLLKKSRSRRAEAAYSGRTQAAVFVRNIRFWYYILKGLSVLPGSDVITSYSIHYTKLYEALQTFGPRLTDGAAKVRGILHERQNELGPVLRSSLSRSALITAAVALVAVILGIAAAILIARTIIGPLNATAQAAQAVAEGRTDIDVTPRGSDEIATLQRSLIGMVGQLQARMSAAEKATEEA